ncbi:TPA: hypothetical protein ACGQK4_003382 [Elizabethkingia anophelis]|uniref:hypothetical protein n=1 Tax=Elizabethkingia anophelis TaxID=1117645 RepID=UPI001365F92E|nr:hypothetical protein [Elizabethkingia anophelis]MCT3979120.1 hypothetical protein [Elizabethkingia anophelis]MCT4203894.1 hypothetical protein [Elizabethkingia anophelis]MCT4207410.1 hypothetical protein [Elizabethkingia anophelis]MDV4013623.1 hypothetical protein [Elizabethkingia anophelis]MVW83584.1 hypothetical protein [Elizabethkingia anophelis]
MNSHLNVFKTYSKENRIYQLENDLTRAFAISIQEDPLFFYEVLKFIFKDNSQFDLLFSDTEVENKLKINIQENSKYITNYEKIIAVSLSNFEMTPKHFWNQTNHQEYDPICDVVIYLNDTLIIIETKRDTVDCTSQLYNQAYNIVKNSNNIEQLKEIVEPKDLNWRKLMQIASKVLSFQKTVGSVNRFTFDFINLVKGHNPNWLPETPIAALSKENKHGIYRRIESAINEMDIKHDYKKLTYNDRLGLTFSQPWAQEILFHIKDDGNLVITVYAGNTKAQSWHILSRNVNIKNQLTIDGKDFNVHQGYHIKLTSFQKFFTGLWVYDKDFKKSGLYCRENYHKYSGRKVKNKGHWEEIENLFDEYFIDSYDWRKELRWQEKVLDTNKNQFDLSFGYELYIIIPFEELKNRDNSQSNLNGLIDLIKASYKAFENDIID